MLQNETETRCRRVADAAVDHPVPLEGEEISGVGRVLEHVRRSLEDRAGPGPGGGVRAGARMESSIAKASLVVGHRLRERIPDAE